MAEEKREDSVKSSSKKPQFKRNRPELDGVPDLSQLVYLDMPNVLHNVQFRYCEMARKQCYTSISSILLAINPYETLPIYGQDVINEFHTAALKGRQVTGRPHPYGVSARSYMRMVQRKCNQSVIVCGESGAGKTETTKLLMRYLAMTAPISPDKQTTNTASIEEQIIAASPILEAYGNAKTVMNNNSSRFGKFTKLLYHVPVNTQKGTILGSSLETYLLEKSRVVFQAVNERNYHIFYFLHAGLGLNNTEYGLQSVDKFHYSNQGKCYAPMKDVERYKELQESLNMFRIGNDVQKLLWKITSGVLNLGNIQFIRKGDGFAAIDKKSMKYLEIVSKLWGLNATQLEKRLTTKSLQAGGSNIIQKIQYDDAVSNRDSIAKGIYENIFLWLCKRINAELLVEDENDDDEDEGKTDEENGKYFIGILDVFGFENFYFNSLEQFCINYTNEKLQQYFNFHIIQSEQEEYLKESVFWKPLTIPDNEQYIRLVEHPKNGFWTLLDSSCNGPSKNDTVAFMQLLFRKHDKNPVIHKKTKAGSGNWRGEKPKKTTRRRGGAAKFDGFMINHFADDVTYNVKNFLIKNMESVHSDTNKMIKKSSESIFKEINGADGASGRRRRRTRKSVTAVFYKGIKTLMRNLNQTEPYFVRCINPNKQKSHKVWTEEIVEHQLRCGGLLEALRVLKLGYPTRVPYQLLYEQYHSAVSNPLIKNMNPEAFSTSLLIAFDVDDNDYELGLTKIFFKPSKAAILDTIMSKAGQPLSDEQNDKITRYIVQKRCKQIIGTVKAFTALRKLVRMKRAAKEWQVRGRIASLIGGTVMKHLYIARKQIRERKELEGAMLMQSFFRAMVERKQFIAKRDGIKDAVHLIWSGYNAMKQRQGVRYALDTMIEQRIERLRVEKEEKDKVAAAQAAKLRAEEEKNRAQAAKISKEEEMKILREKAKEEQLRLKKIADEEKEEEQRLREEIDARKKEQEERGSIHETEKKSIEDTKALKKKIIEQNQREREMQDAKARKLRKAQAKERKKRRYKQNPGDVTDYDTNSESEPDMVTDSEDDDEEEEDIKVLLSRFHKIAAMGQLFYRHAGNRMRGKPQDRVVKVSFDASGNAKEISWGSGSRHIFFKDIMYIAWGHYTPAFVARKDKLSPKKCLSIVSTHGKILDLEAYSELMAELWVKGLRRLKGHNDEQSDEMAKKNQKNLMDSNKNEKKQKANDRRKINDIMRLQQDLFIMSTHTVFRHLEEERIWNIDNSVKELFLPQKMYQIALKQDIPWRQWQHWVREQVTTYLRENDGVLADPYRRSSRVALDANGNSVPVQNQPVKPAFAPTVPPMSGWVPPVQNQPVKPSFAPQIGREPVAPYVAPMHMHYPSASQSSSVNYNPNTTNVGNAEEEKCSLM